YLYRLNTPAPFAVLVGQALQLPDSLVLPTLLNPQFDPARLLLVPPPPEGHVGVPTLQAIPPARSERVLVKPSRAGRYDVHIDPPAQSPGYLFLSENYDPAWHAVIDGGAPVPVVRAQYAFIAVPLPSGARDVTIAFDSKAYQRGKAVTLVASLALLLVLAGGAVRTRRTAGNV